MDYTWGYGSSRLCVYCVTGVERLAGMSLSNPERVAVSKDNSVSQSRDIMTVNQSSSTDDTFALPENLQQYYVVTPCKLRLVTLLTFLMSRYKVSLILLWLTYDSQWDWGGGGGEG